MNKIETKEAETIEGIKLVDDPINFIKNYKIKHTITNGES